MKTARENRTKMISATRHKIRRFTHLSVLQNSRSCFSIGSRNALMIALAQTGIARVLLHTLCLLRHPARRRWHWQGIRRELAGFNFPSAVLFQSSRGAVASLPTRVPVLKEEPWLICIRICGLQMVWQQLLDTGAARF